MAGYFGDEPTCRRCDYPRRLHHLLRVDHDYEDAPGPAATGTEGEETTNQEEGDSVPNDTAPNGVITPVRTAEENVATLELADNEDFRYVTAAIVDAHNYLSGGAQ